MKKLKLAFLACGMAMYAVAGAQTADDPSVQIDNTVTAGIGSSGVIVGVGYTQDTSGGEESVADGWNIDFSADSASITAVTPEVFDGTNWVTCTSTLVNFAGLDAYACSQSSNVITVSLENLVSAPLSSQNIGDFFRLNVDISGSAPATPIDFLIENHRPAVGADDMALGTFGAANQDGQITIEGPALSFDLPPGETLDTGSAPVGSTTAGGVITATEAGTATDNVRLQSCGISAEANGTFNLTYSGAPFPDTFTGGSGASETLTVTCDPASGAAATATLTCEVQDPVDNSVIASPSWPLTCQGQVPDVQVSDGTDTTVALSANVGGSDTGNMFVFNTGGADATGASLDQTSADATEISVTTGLADGTITAGTTVGSPDDTLVFSCSSMATASVSETFVISYDDLGSGNSPSTTITVNCEVTDTAPTYNSTPIEPNETFVFGEVDNGSSASLSIDVFNDNDIGDPFNITGVTASGSADYSVESFNSGPYPGVSNPDGGDDVTVSCNPSGVGVLPTGTLEVVTDTAGTHTYDLTCEGTGDVVTSTPPAGGTLNLGTVPPGTQTNPGTISFTNNGLTGDVTVSCGVTDNSAAGDVFTFTPETIQFSLAPAGSEDVEFRCTPPDISPFTAAVSCTYGGAIMGGADFTVSCAGRPLVIPTMSRWGLVVMSLVLLLVAGVAGRRMMA